MRTKCFFGFHKWKLYNTQEGSRIGTCWSRIDRVPHSCVIYRKCECCGVIEW